MEILPIQNVNISDIMKIKYLVFFFLLFLIFTGCKTQLIVLGWNDEMPSFKKNKKISIFRKDDKNIRDNFYGVWKGVQGTKELLMYFYKLSDVPVGVKIYKTNRHVDAVFGYYIYKENGVIRINSKGEALKNNKAEIVRKSPFYGIPQDSKEINRLLFKDYGIQIQNGDGTYSPKGTSASFEITKKNVNDSTIAKFIITEGRNGVMVRSIKKGVIPEPYNYNFSMPTEWTVVKISNNPPQLE